MKFMKHVLDFIAGDLGYQVPKQVLLSWLAEREPIDRERTPEPVESLEITAQGQERVVQFAHRRG